MLLPKKLGDLPLAVDLAGCYLKECFDVSPVPYLTELDNSAVLIEHESLHTWAKAEDNPTNHATSLATSFSLSWKMMTDEEADLLAKRIFRACGYCYPNISIPKKLLEELSEASNKSLYRALGRLSELGLIEPTDDGPRLHPMMAEFGRLIDRDAGNMVLPDLADALIKLITRALQSGLPQQMSPMSEHLTAVALAAEKEGLWATGALWNNLASYQRVLADYKSAKILFERASKIDEKVYGPDHPDVANDVNNLGLVLKDLGDLQEARECFERALKIDEKVKRIMILYYLIFLV
jgi:tetratricopeptide (TPR) repeat protein